MTRGIASIGLDIVDQLIAMNLPTEFYVTLLLTTYSKGTRVGNTHGYLSSSSWPVLPSQ